MKRKHQEVMRLLELIETQAERIKELEEDLRTARRIARRWIRTSAHLAMRLTQELEKQ